MCDMLIALEVTMQMLIECDEMNRKQNFLPLSTVYNLLRGKEILFAYQTE